MRVDIVKLRVAAWKELLQNGGTLSGDEGGQCSARIKFLNLTVTADWEELCLTMQCWRCEAHGYCSLGGTLVSQRRSAMQCKLRQAQGCCSFGGTLSDNEGRQCSASLVKLRDAAAWEEHCLTMRIAVLASSVSRLLQFGKNSVCCTCHDCMSNRIKLYV